MTIHEYGTDNQQVIVLVHPSVVMWDFFEYLIPLLKEEYHLIVPALPGYDEENPKEDFTSVEKIADELAKWLTEHKINTVDILYGCSMGGAVVLKILAEQKIHVRHAVCDGGITPYQLPWLVTRLIAVKDFLMTWYLSPATITKCQQGTLLIPEKLQYWCGEKKAGELESGLSM